MRHPQPGGRKGETGQSGTAVLSTSIAGVSQQTPPGPQSEPTRATRVLGWAAAAAIAVSILLIAAAAAAGPSAVVWPIGRTWPMPPWWFSLHPSDLSAVGAIYVAVILGAAGVGCGLLAVRRGARPSIRAVLAGAAVAVAVLTVLPPAGSTDSVSYATYGRIADIGHNPYVMTPAQLRPAATRSACRRRGTGRPTRPSTARWRPRRNGAPPSSAVPQSAASSSG